MEIGKYLLLSPKNNLIFYCRHRPANIVMRRQQSTLVGDQWKVPSGAKIISYRGEEQKSVCCMRGVVGRQLTPRHGRGKHLHNGPQYFHYQWRCHLSRRCYAKVSTYWYTRNTPLGCVVIRRVFFLKLVMRYWHDLLEIRFGNTTYPMRWVKMIGKWISYSLTLVSSVNHLLFFKRQIVAHCQP